MLFHPKALLMLIHCTRPIPVSLSHLCHLKEELGWGSHEAQIGRREQLVVAITMKVRAKLRVTEGK